MLRMYYEDGDAAEILRDIRYAWKNVVRMERDSRAWTVDREIPYRQWILERVKQVKLPFRQISPCLMNEGRAQNVESEEVKQLKEEVIKLRKKNAKITEDLLGLRHSYADLKRDNMEKTEAYEGLLRKQKAERDYTYRIKQDLAAANKELTIRAQERNVASSAECQWKNLYEDIKRDKQEAMRRLQDLQIQVNVMEHQVKDTMDVCEERVNEERMRLMTAEERHQAVMTRARDYMEEQEKDVVRWKRNFFQLAALANGAIDDVPRMLREADTVTFRDPHREVQAFLDHCKWLVQ